jgi:hypothetical protein
VLVVEVLVLIVVLVLEEEVLVVVVVRYEVCVELVFIVLLTAVAVVASKPESVYRTNERFTVTVVVDMISFIVNAV